MLTLRQRDWREKGENTKPLNDWLWSINKLEHYWHSLPPNQMPYWYLVLLAVAGVFLGEGGVAEVREGGGRRWSGDGGGGGGGGGGRRWGRSYIINLILRLFQTAETAAHFAPDLSLLYKYILYIKSSLILSSFFLSCQQCCGAGAAWSRHF